MPVPGNPNAGQMFHSSFTEGKLYASRVFTGRIVSFNLDTFAVSVHLDNTDNDLENVQVAMPYFHYEAGEGFFSVPEVGARCVVTYPSDGSEAFVSAFLAVVEEVSGTTLDEGQSAGGQASDGETAQEMEDRGAEADDQDSMESSSEPISYRNGRPLTRPGDMMWRTRDGNSIELRRGGLVSIGANAICRRLYIPINGLIQDFAKNHDLTTPGVHTSCELHEQDSEDTSVEYKLIVREYAEDSNASVSLRIGELDDDFFSLAISRNGVNYKKGTVIQESELLLKFSKEGDATLECGTNTIEAEEMSVTVTGSMTEEFGSLDQTVDGARDISFKTEVKDGKTSEEKLEVKTINAKKVNLGSGARGPLVRADLFIPFWNGHVHTFVGGTTAPPSIILTSQMIGTKNTEGS